MTRLTHSEIIDSAWPKDMFKEGVSTESLYQAIRRLRQGIEPNPIKPVYIISWRGSFDQEGGYQFYPEGRSADTNISQTTLLNVADVSLLIEQINWHQSREGLYSERDPIKALKSKLYELRDDLKKTTGHTRNELNSVEISLLSETVRKNIAFVRKHEYSGMTPDQAEKQRQQTLLPILSLAEKLELLTGN